MTESLPVLMEIAQIAPWVAMGTAILLFLWRIAQLRVDVQQYHDEKLSAFADRLDERLAVCERDREELRVEVAALTIEVSALQTELAYATDPARDKRASAG